MDNYFLAEFTNEKEHIKAFLGLPSAVYKGDKNYVKENAKKVTSWLVRNHPCSTFLVQKNLLVYKNGVAAARGIAFVNKVGGFGSIGFFECLEDEIAVEMLMRETRKFCSKYDIEKIYAAMNGSIWGNYRLMTKGFEHRPFLGEPYNRPYYYDLLIKNGFSVAQTWQSQFVKSTKPNEFAKRIKFITSLKQSNSIKIRPMQNFDEDILILYDLIMSSFSEFFLFHPIEKSTFVELYKDLKRILDKRTMFLAFDKNDNPLGFGIAIPNYKNIFEFLFKKANCYILWLFGLTNENGISKDFRAYAMLLNPILKFLYDNNKGCISALMSENSKALTTAKSYDYTHEYALLELSF